MDRGYQHRPKQTNSTIASTAGWSKATPSTQHSGIISLWKPILYIIISWKNGMLQQKITALPNQTATGWMVLMGQPGAGGNNTEQKINNHSLSWPNQTATERMVPMGQPGGGGNTEQKINNLSADQTRPPPTKRVQERQALLDKGRKPQNNKHISNHVIYTQGSNFKNVLRKTLVTKGK